MYDHDQCATPATLGYDVIGEHVITGEATRFGTYNSPATAKETARILAASDNPDLLCFMFKAVRTL